MFFFISVNQKKRIDNGGHACIVRSRLIDWLLLNNQRAIFQLYSGREQVSQYLKTNDTEIW
jgi:hypothetical protein